MAGARPLRGEGVGERHFQLVAKQKPPSRNQSSDPAAVYATYKMYRVFDG